MTGLISVLIPIYKESVPYLKLSIESILNQDYLDLEIIIIIDNPVISPEVFDFLKKIKLEDSRVKLIFNKKNMGLALSLNAGIECAKGKYIARMDADDISMPNRLSKQLSFLVKNNLDLIGSSINLINEDGVYIKSRRMTTCNYSSIAYKTLIFHPTWLGLFSIFDKVKYRDFKYSQDVDFLYRAISQGVRIGVVDEVLLDYRTFESSSEKRLDQFLLSMSIRTGWRNNESSYELIMKNFHMEKKNEKDRKAFLKADYMFLGEGFVGKLKSALYSRYHRIMLLNLIRSKPYCV